MQEEQKELDEILAKRSKAGRSTDEKPLEEKTTLHSMVFVFFTHRILYPVELQSCMLGLLTIHLSGHLAVL